MKIIDYKGKPVDVLSVKNNNNISYFMVLQASLELLSAIFGFVLPSIIIV